jgi:O-acetyl-ADP-ribose deacetylase (regulator of RNase III)
MIKIIECDVFKCGADVIAHQTNCQGKMNSGIAKTIRELYPCVYDIYCEVLSYRRDNNIQPLGTNIYAPVKHTTFVDGELKVIVNMCSQDKYGYDGKQYTSYDAFNDCCKDMIAKTTNRLMKILNKDTITIGMPYNIGCVRGGASWDKIFEILKDNFEPLTNINLLICKFNPDIVEIDKEKM